MRLLSSILAALALVAPSTWGASIELYSDAAFSSCSLTIPAGGTGVFYIVVEDLEHAGLCCGPNLIGTSFSVRGLPTDWLATLTPSPLSNVVMGNPFVEGVQIAFPTSQQGYTIPLFFVTVTPFGPVASATLAVRQGSVPFPWKDFHCTLIWGPGGCPCAADAACVENGILYINTPGDCLVPVSHETWSRVKSLYK